MQQLTGSHLTILELPREVVMRLNPILMVSLISVLAVVACLHAAEPAQPAPVAAEPGLTAYYFDNENFTGASVKTTDAQIDFSWGDAAPKPGIAPHTFSVWWTGYLAAAQSGIYNIRTISSDGVVVQIDGKIVIDNWDRQPASVSTGSIELEAGKMYPFNVRTFNHLSKSACLLQWKIGGVWQTIPASAFFHPVYHAQPVVGTGLGLRVIYSANSSLSGVTVDGGLQSPFIDWRTKSPIAGIPADGWSTAWGGSFETPVTGSYLLLFESDDGISVTIDGQPVIDGYLAGSANRAVFVTGLAGQRHPIQIMHQDKVGPAHLKIRWLYSALNVPEPVPVTQWYAPTPVALGTGAGTGLTATYYPNVGYADPGIVVEGEQINKRWSAAPVAGLSNSGWSVEWDGEIEAPITDTYTFTFGSNDSGLMKLQDQIIIDTVSRHAFSTTSSKAIPLIGGKRYRIHVQLANFNSIDTNALLWWSGELFTTRLVGKDRLFPGFSGSNKPFKCFVPNASKVNPAWIKFTGGTNGVSAFLDDEKISVVRENSVGGYIFSQKSPLGVKLQKGVVSKLVTEKNGVVHSDDIEWELTDLATESGYDPLMLRVGDRLLVTDSTSGSKWAVAINGGSKFVPDYIGQIGDTYEVTYGKPGVYTIVSRIDGKKENRVTVTVVGVNFNGPVACELTYQRLKAVDVFGGPEVGFFPKDNTLLTVEDERSGEKSNLKLRPYRSGTPIVQARLWNLTGPIIAEQEIDEFDIRTTATRRIVIDQKLPDGTYLAHATMLMDPFVPALDVDMKIFVSGVTFDDSTLRRQVSTSLFTRNPDSIWNGVSYLYGMIRAPGRQAGLCHSFTVYQNGVQISY